jgi:hypothetical protein
VVVAVGETDLVPLVPTLPTPLSIEPAVALVELQERVELLPTTMLVGLTESVQVGVAGGGGVEPLVTEALSIVSVPIEWRTWSTVIDTTPVGTFIDALNVPQLLPVAGASPTQT